MKDEVLLDGRFGYGCNWDHEDLALKNKHSIYPKQYNSERLSFKGLVMAVNLKLQMVESANVVVGWRPLNNFIGHKLLGFKDNLMANGLPNGAMIFEIVRDEINLEIDEPIYGEEMNECEKFGGFIDLPSSENINENERERPMFLCLYLDEARSGSCLEDCRRVRLQMEQFEIELDESCLTGLTTQRTELDRGFGRMGIDLVKATLESMLGDGGSSSNSSNRITPTARPDLGTATIQ
ncbi:hypothetical protein BY996DRAFT_6475439 [Phakopsora pachyrhizi]|nr:hypothetical protein BY996DRAFT_6475439 [Phakopsora pachyrhizi]